MRFAKIPVLTLVLISNAALVTMARGGTLEYTVTSIGDTPGNDTGLYADSINNSGTVVGATVTASGARAYIWTAGSGMTILGTIPSGATYSYALGINNSNQVTGYTGSPSGNQAYVWTSGTGIQATTSSGGLNLYSGTGINNNGTVVGNYAVGGGPNSAVAVWDPIHGVQSIGQLPGAQYVGGTMNGSAINDNGQVAGWSRNTTTGNNQAWIWTPGSGFQSLGALSGGLNNSVPQGMNNQAQVVGYINAGGEPNNAFIWDSTNGLKLLGTLSGYTASTAAAINNLGQAVGASYIPGANESSATLWDPTLGNLNLNNLLDPTDSGWTLQAAWGINDNGQILATGYDNGVESSVVLTPESVPLPPAAFLGLVVMAGLAVFRLSQHVRHA